MEITAAQVQQGLETVRKRLYAILDDRAEIVIEQAKSKLRDSKCQHDASRRQRPKGPPKPWGFYIPPGDPLRFRETKVHGLKLRVDLFLKEYWADEPAEEPCELNVAIRVWCLDPHIFFRENWDSRGLESQIDPESGRVMLRIHFDLANPNQSGPKYHAQVGGNQRPGEFCWFPEAIDVPRILHTPVDLILASELVAATFYPNKYEQIKREDAWKGSRRVSQKHLLQGYFEDALAAVQSDESVLDALWNAT